MKKIIISGFVIIAFALYAVFNHKSQNIQSAVPLATGKTGTSQSGHVQASKALSQMYTDGTYIGKAIDAFYGNIQVKALISGGKITDVQFLQYPNDQRESVEINTEALPVLSQEAIQSQSANVDTVSGATDSTQAFKESLASALSQAQ
ncbi:MAG: FMN-binding protein [Candidatus Levyibacteriota bacterium]